MGYPLTYHDGWQLPTAPARILSSQSAQTMANATTKRFDTLLATHLYLPPGRRKLQEQRQHPTAGR
jgi:hypothetical protein